MTASFRIPFSRCRRDFWGCRAFSSILFHFDDALIIYTPMLWPCFTRLVLRLFGLRSARYRHAFAPIYLPPPAAALSGPAGRRGHRSGHAPLTFSVSYAILIPSGATQLYYCCIAPGFAWATDVLPAKIPLHFAPAPRDDYFHEGQAADHGHFMYAPRACTCFGVIFCLRDSP